MAKRPKLTWKARLGQIATTVQPWLMTLAVLGSIGGVGYWFWKFGGQNPAAVPPQSKPSDISLRFTGVELKGRKEGSPIWTIRSGQVEVSKEHRYVYFKQKPKGEFYNLKDWEKEADSNARKRQVKWQAENAEYDTQREKLQLRDKVRIDTDSKDVMRSNDLEWDKPTETIKTETRTRVLTQKKTYIEADKLEAKTRLKELYLQGNVMIEMDVGKERSIGLNFEEKMR